MRACFSQGSEKTEPLGSICVSIPKASEGNVADDVGRLFTAVITSE